MENIFKIPRSIQKSIFKISQGKKTKIKIHEILKKKKIKEIHEYFNISKKYGNSFKNIKC